MKEPVRFVLNGADRELSVDPDRSLLWVLRADLGLTGTKFGCGEGYCGSCTVLVDDDAVRSCLLTMREVRGKSVTTIEGLARDGKLHPVQQAFIDHGALQCGYCTPGMILNAVGLLRRNPRPDRSRIVQDMEANLCRCGAHQRILRAIEAVVEAGSEVPR
jgi:aerobic-type carbon monoxide dehydrogenase small subunit (CoxS/CutS family)